MTTGTRGARDERHTRIETGAQRTQRVAALTTGGAAVVMAIYQVATPGAPTATYESWSDFLREFLMLAYLTGSIAAMWAAWRTGLASRSAFLLVTVGYALITVGVAIGLLLREDLEWFFVLAAPGLLLSGMGFLVFAVTAWRASALPRWAALLAGVGGFFAIVLAELGTTVLIGSFWLYVGSALRPNAEGATR